MKNKEDIILKFNALAPPIEKQLNKQGLTVGDRADHFEKYRRSINYLRIYDIASEGETYRMCRRLHKQIINSPSLSIARENGGGHINE